MNSNIVTKKYINLYNDELDEALKVINVMILKGVTFLW
jgi:hypothetical protein